MKDFIKCEECNLKMAGDEKCCFAVYKKIINGQEHYFCCERHAEKYKREREK